MAPAVRHRPAPRRLGRRARMRHRPAPGPPGTANAATTCDNRLGPGPPPGTRPQDYLRRVKITLEPIARGRCDHGNAEPRLPAQPQAPAPDQRPQRAMYRPRLRPPGRPLRQRPHHRLAPRRPHLRM
jgi:hypothetical protein